MPCKTPNYSGNVGKSGYRVVAFLQNAWSPLYAGRTWPRRSWLRALHLSRSGQRLRILAAASPGVEFWYDNTTPIVGATPDSVIPPDYGHIATVIDQQCPDVLVAFGKQAAVALRHQTFRPILAMPHPACRVLTDDLYRHAGSLLSTRAVDGFVHIEQKRGEFTVTKTIP